MKWFKSYLKNRNGAKLWICCIQSYHEVSKWLHLPVVTYIVLVSSVDPVAPFIGHQLLSSSTNCLWHGDGRWMGERYYGETRCDDMEAWWIELWRDQRVQFIIFWELKNQSCATHIEWLMNQNEGPCPISLPTTLVSARTAGCLRSLFISIVWYISKQNLSQWQHISS